MSRPTFNLTQTGLLPISSISGLRSHLRTHPLLVIEPGLCEIPQTARVPSHLATEEDEVILLSFEHGHREPQKNEKRLTAGS